MFDEYKLKVLLEITQLTSRKKFKETSPHWMQLSHPQS